MKKNGFTILIVTYNSDWRKLRVTLESVLAQTFGDYEIVVADDGSEDNLEDKIREYFKAKNFDRYTLVMNKENQGTVKNLISGLEASGGEFVRDFGAGDLFYNETVLERLYDFMKAGDHEAAAGLIKGFSVTEKGIIARRFSHPFDIEAYRKGDEDRIIRNMALYGDYFSGAVMCYKTDYYLEYLRKISPYVKYEEDIFQLLAALEGRRVVLWDEYMVWYEMGYGVSTGGSSAFAELLARDTENFYNHIIEEHGDNKHIAKRAKLQKYYKYKNVYVRTLMRLFENRGLVSYLCSHALQIAKGSYGNGKKSRGFLQDKAFVRESQIKEWRNI